MMLHISYIVTYITLSIFYPQYIVVKFLDENTSKTAIPDFHYNLSRLMVQLLEERHFMIQSFMYLFKHIGVKECLNCLENSLHIIHSGGSYLIFC